ncbi:hypothetical protein [Ornithinimicrobium sp. W1665]|uniref:hypothetical protein n=1 Tax=Ornithinimicrobium sp. W1665 TaxID=3416666 RepID=UPI003D6B95FE
MRSSDLRVRYWRIVLFFARVTAGFIWWEIVLRRLGAWAGSRRAPARSAVGGRPCASERSPSRWVG